MKYGKDLEENAVRRYLPHYIDYMRLKELLKGAKDAIHNKAPSAEAVMASKSMERRTTLPNNVGTLAGQKAPFDMAEVTFMKAVDRELERVNGFAVAKAKELRASLIDALSKLEREGLGNTLALYEGLAEEVRQELVMLDRFVRQNTTGFRKIMKKHDKWTKNQASAWFLPRLAQEPFNCLDFDGMLVLLSDTFVKIRAVKQTNAPKSSTWVPPESFERKTTKYWIREDDLMHIKTSVIKHLPLLIFGRKQGETPKEVQAERGTPKMTLSSLSSAGKPRQEVMSESDAALITSVYFDNDDVEMYTRRIHQEEGNRLVRIRWYGELTTEESEAFIERKTHHESWVLEDSVKERFNLKRKHIVPFLQGTWNPDHKLDKLVAQGKMKKETAEKQKILAAEIYQIIKEKNLRPFVRTVYRRSAYQLASTNEVRISLDTDLFMINERVEPEEYEKMLENGRWCHDLEATISSADIVAFPFAVFEVKLQTEEPAWVSELVNSDAATEVWKFSKFQHGIGLLHRDRVKVLPHWFEKIEGLSLPDDEEKNEKLRALTIKSSATPSSPQRVSRANGESARDEQETSRTDRSREEITESPIVKEEKPKASEPGRTRAEPSAIHVNFQDTDDLIVNDFRRHSRNPFKRLAARIRAKTHRRGGKGRRVGNGNERDVEMGAAGAAYDAKNAFAKGIYDSKGRKLDAKKPMKIEPKTFFANERTLLQWLNTAVVIALIGVNLMSFGTVPALIFGALLSLVSVTFNIYALIIFKRRSHSIASREPIRYDDRYGPMILVPALIITILLSVAFTIGYNSAPSASVPTPTSAPTT